ncbi:hypothetical protein DSCOOX_02060 [Desulfosarcina ovata subsp. ovata]|uniref:Reverse transcriptase domain-containing protein n=1 Tax=Desulfosarcina ovata subsp. ovata TaxID=2752305 RepID=A0A5K8A3L8_9BACT|nr:hypothetical protein DSCOOX_02060 [Desulfosarcina ovata subsp. ovata]
MQVLQEEWDSTFSDFSYGFRPKRSAHQAIKQSQRYLKQGYRWVVDMDLDKFFDRVNHDKLMSVVLKRVRDRRVNDLIQSFLRSVVEHEGSLVKTEMGTPQGGLCKALHNPPYAKFAIMQSKSLNVQYFQHMH